MRLKYYSGIGSRETPDEVGRVMANIAQQLEQDGYILRSGAATGADSFFEEGVQDPQNKEIYLPDKDFNGSTSQLFGVSPEALEMASTIHPAWDRCKPFVRKLHARNCYQVLGKDLRTPADFVICWTQYGKIVGGTATAIRLAQRHGIPVLNLGSVKTGQYQVAFENFLAFQVE